MLEKGYRLATTGNLDHLQTVLRPDLCGSQCGDIADMTTVMLLTMVTLFHKVSLTSWVIGF
jgi:hypothetical protein